MGDCPCALAVGPKSFLLRAEDFTSLDVIREDKHVLMIKVLVLEPEDLGSILSGGFLEGHDFTTSHGRFGGRPPLGCETSGSGLQRARGHSFPHINGPSTQPLVYASRCAR